ncbi:PREDICTED: glutathione S-transferase T3-like [Brassica oleracea var. oleracea]|uniref:glutathione S-transferase T3-like n=1 Tax=Brassica oleracea var. oleracea TaxID=109376 RepID=UPI0006A71501|nr:PREDICTED: glutathione S-transferase T3-like [Brassica oleracea var. oleracea]
MQGSMDRFLVKSANLNESGRSGDEFDDPMEDENEINDEDVNEEDKEVEDDVTDVTEEDDNLSEKENEDVNDQMVGARDEGSSNKTSTMKTGSLNKMTTTAESFASKGVHSPEKRDFYQLILSSFTSEMEFNPFTEPSNFVELLSSQQSVSLSEAQVPFYGTQGTEPSNFGEDNHASRKERRTWSPGDDVLLISSWLNTSKDAVVGNEQRLNAFWKRIAAYYNASTSVGGCEKREPTHCKNRWQKINDQVCMFCGAYEAANREKTSGQNENDVLKLAHQIFFTNHNKKITLEHAWKELRNDQKWCELSTAKNDGGSKKRKCGDVSHSASSKATEVDSSDDDEATTHPPGVKAAKARSKKTMSDGKELSEFQTMWNIK